VKSLKSRTGRVELVAELQEQSLKSELDKLNLKSRLEPEEHSLNTSSGCNTRCTYCSSSSALPALLFKVCSSVWS
jgi:tRNA A37 methylthiotransferase MiaB